LNSLNEHHTGQNETFWGVFGTKSLRGKLGGQNEAAAIRSEFTALNLR
jgi:hypothetical protein